MHRQFSSVGVGHPNLTVPNHFSIKNGAGQPEYTEDKSEHKINSLYGTL